MRFTFGSFAVFATAGVFPTDEEGQGYTDVRLKQEEFESLRGTGDLAKNLNRVPVLNHNGFVLGQSTAIARYLGRHFGLYGRNPQESAEIDAMMAHVDDVKSAWRKLFPYRVELTDEQKAENNKIWFDTPSDPPIEGRKERLGLNAGNAAAGQVLAQLVEGDGVVAVRVDGLEQPRSLRRSDPRPSS